MSIEIKVPTLPESIADATVVTWHKQPGDAISRDEVVVEVETDKVVLEVPASESGVLGEIIEEEGATVTAHQVIGTIEPGDGGGSTDGAAADETTEPASDAKPASDAETAARDDAGYGDASSPDHGETGQTGGQTGPVVRRLLEEHGLEREAVKGTGRHGRITKEDVERAASARPTASASSTPAASPADSGDDAQVAMGAREEKRVPMTRLRKRIAERLLEATQTTAMLTTFNEVNMQGFIDLRNQYKERFEKTHDVRLGFMSIFVKAATEALKRYPDVNASIDGDDIVYHGFCDIGVAVSSDRGLVVPVLRNTESMSLADMEKGIAEYAVKARDGKITLDDMTGGTFTVSNGGVFGSLLSTPILNPPQSAILGMHATQERPVAENGQVVIRPMMYIALSYDHRIVDGKGAVTFLKTIKELVEDPARIVFDL